MVKKSLKALRGTTPWLNGPGSHGVPSAACTPHVGGVVWVLADEVRSPQISDSASFFNV